MQRPVRLLFGALIAACLITGVLGGLLRAGVTRFGFSPVLLQATVFHAPLMISAFFGSVIAVERAVALKQFHAFLVPAAAALSGMLLLAGYVIVAAWLAAAAALLFIIVNVAIVLKQPAAHTGLLLVSAAAWTVGNLLFAVTLTVSHSLPWWFAFLIITIAAERLEMTRLMRRVPWSQPALLTIIALMLASAAVSWFSPFWGNAAFGVTLFGLAWWLAMFDIARRTLYTQGLSRYMAVCLLTGYGWLALGGVAWALMHTFATRDLALHSLGLGFIFSMIMAHAPVILPAITRLRVPYTQLFYVPLITLHATLLFRVVGGYTSASAKMQGAIMNALALLIFAFVVIIAIRRGRRGRR